MSEERFKFCPISHCRACGYARYKLNVGLLIAEPASYSPSGNTRIYTGCGKADGRSFGSNENVFGPENIPEWCPLPDAPKEIGDVLIFIPASVLAEHPDIIERTRAIVSDSIKKRASGDK